MRTKAFARPMVAGLLGGLAAGFAMNSFMRGIAIATSRRSRDVDPQRVRAELAVRTRDWQQAADPTGEISDRAARILFGRGLSRKQRRIAGPVVHYVTAALLGTTYAVASDWWPAVKARRGLFFGVALWLIADELAVPALGLMPSPTEIPLAAHAAMFSSHMVYGATLETVRRKLCDAA